MSASDSPLVYTPPKHAHATSGNAWVSNSSSSSYVQVVQLDVSVLAPPFVVAWSADVEPGASLASGSLVQALVKVRADSTVRAWPFAGVIPNKACHVGGAWCQTDEANTITLEIRSEEAGVTVRARYADIVAWEAEVE